MLFGKRGLHGLKSVNIYYTGENELRAVKIKDVLVDGSMEGGEEGGGILV